MEFKYILSRKRPFSSSMHSLCKNENIPMWESTLPHNKRSCFPPYPDHYLKDDFSHYENVVSHMIEPSYGRNFKSTVYSIWATCYMRQCVDKTVIGNDLRIENRKGNNLICLFWLQR